MTKVQNPDINHKSNDHPGFISSSVRDQILESADIVQVIGKYLTLKIKGKDYTSLCPFHNEKTPSFSVSPSLQKYKCFGCDESGDVIDFLKKHLKLSYPEAIRMLGKDLGIEIPTNSNSAEDEEKQRMKEQLYAFYEYATKFYQEMLYHNENKSALDYVIKRFDKESLSTWRIGFAPSGNDLYKTAQNAGYPDDFLLTTGLFNRNEATGQVYDYFRNRLMFPVVGYSGRVMAYTARFFDGKNQAAKDTPKWLNSPETPIYSKSNALYGLNHAAKHAKENGVIICEGAADCIALYKVGAKAAVAPCGTSLSPDQVKLIRRYSDTIHLIYDGDEAGKAATIRNGEFANQEGLHVYCTILPEGEDPESFFKTEEKYRQYLESYRKDFILWRAEELFGKANNSIFDRVSAVEKLCKMIFGFDKGKRAEYIKQIAKSARITEKVFNEELRKLDKEDGLHKTSELKRMIPPHVNINDLETYGFYEDNNQYFFRTAKGLVRGSNFVLKPISHVTSAIEAKRLFEITNVYGFSRILELPQKDFTNLQSFRLRAESQGNFLFEGSEADFLKIKRYLYENTETCSEIKQLGWQREGFWAWSNGIFNGSFQQVNDYGIVEHNGNHFYIPALSKIYAGEPRLYAAERQFIHKPGSISMQDLVLRMEQVFGPNALIAFSFYLATSYFDIITGRFGFFPILNLFGPKGAGKTMMAHALLHFFGPQPKGPSISNISLPALADHVAQNSNALCHIDEYKNSIDINKVEFLKGLWDVRGRNVKNMDKDKKREMSDVDAGIMLSGQEMTNIDIALFTRLIFLTFNQTEYNEQEKERFNRLFDILKAGITHLHHEVLSHREYFCKHYFDNYTAVCADLNRELGNRTIEDRIFRNWAVILAAFYTLKDKISTHIQYDQLISQSVELIVRQNYETKRTNEVATFWDIFAYLVKENELVEKVDFRVEYRGRLKTDRLCYDFTAPPRNVLFLNHTRVFQKYRKHGANTRDFVLPVKTMEYYLMNSKEYIGRKKSVSFVLKPGQGEDYAANGKLRRQITSSHIFDYDLLQSNYDLNVINVEVESEDIAEQDEDSPSKPLGSSKQDSGHSDSEDDERLPF